MQFDPQKHNRRSMRLKGYDYAQPGAYFVTLVTQDRANLFGEITDGVMCLSRIGEIIRSAWLRLPGLFPIHHDEWVIMPNHLHAIIWILDLGKGEASDSQDIWDPWRHLMDASPQHQAIGTKSGSLGAIIQNFKSISTRKINQGRGEASATLYHAASLHSMTDASPLDQSSAMHHATSLHNITDDSPKRGQHIWQRNYYEDIIHNQPELDQIRQYIADNPYRWVEDQENPEKSG
jgi:putative transposase